MTAGGAEPVVGAPNVGVVIPAAGVGRRMGGVRKPFLELRGEPVLMWAVRPFLCLPEVTSVAIAVSPEVAANPPAWLTDLDPRIRIVPGGETRRHSVWNAIQTLPDEVTVIAVHDAARPLVDSTTVSRCVAIAQSGDGAVAGVPMTDTLKRVDPRGRIMDTPDRSNFWTAQTPQVFPRALLVDAYRLADAEDWPATDDSALVERAGGTVRMVEASRRNLKLTRTEDVALAEAFLEAGG